MGLSRQEYRSEFPCPSPGDLPNPGIEPGSAVLQADSSPSEPQRKPLMLANCAIMGKSFNSPCSIYKIIGELVDLRLICTLLMLSPAFCLAPFPAIYFSLALIAAHSLVRERQKVAERAWVLESNGLLFESQLCPSWLWDLGQFS